MNVILAILIALVAGVGFAMLLYFREFRSALTKRQRLFLALLRGISVMTIILLLSAILINTKKRHTEKPIIVLVSDNSKSIVIHQDSLFFFQKYPSEIEQLKNNLSEKADVFSYEFDSELRQEISYTFNGQQTDISSALENILLRYEGRNIAGLILLTDGIFNAGFDPTTLADKFFFPIHTVGLGDTTQIADIEIKSVRYNKIVGFGNRFPIEIVVHANGMQGKQVKLKIQHEGKNIASEIISINSPFYSETKTFVFDAEKKGLNKYDIIIEHIPEDLNKANNYSSAIIQVTEKKNKVAILYHAPHPDISALKSALDDARNFEIETHQIASFNSADLAKFDAIVLYQLPDKRIQQPVVEQILNSKKPFLLIIGQNTDIRKLSQLDIGLKIQQSAQHTQEALPQLNGTFSMFQSSNELQRDLKILPPLITYFGNYSISENFQVYMYQKIGNVQTTNPLIAFSTTAGKTNAFITGEGIFKWKLHNYLHNGNHLIFNEIIQKTMDLLVQQADKRRLKIHHKDIYFSTENTEITAELYNMSMEMITSADVFFIIQNENGQSTELKFTPQLSDYRLNLGKLKPGKYKWKAYTLLDGQRLEDEGLFFVEQVLIEYMNKTANHILLKFLSDKTNGKFFHLSEINQLSEYILKNTELKKLEYSTEDSDQLISLKWILILLILSLSTEWAARKYFGSY